jgi:hypothetical protein
MGDRELSCEHAGHDWAPAGGGLMVCMLCEVERWDDELDPDERTGGDDER